MRPAVPAVGDRAHRRRLRGLRPEPGTIEYKPYTERAETQAQGDLIVTVALPTATEAADIYGADLAEKQIQPVWIEVRKQCGRALLVPSLRARSQLLRRV